MLNEGIFFSDEDYFYKKDLWESGRSNVLLVTGSSGSGKSTLSKELSLTNNATHIDLDTFEFLDYYKKLGLDEPKFRPIKRVPGVKPKINFSEEYPKYLKFVIDYTKKHKNEKFVIEGVWIIKNDVFDLVKQYPIIVKNTSYILSSIRRFIRDLREDIKYEGWNLDIKELLIDLYYQISNTPNWNQYMEQFKEKLHREENLNEDVSYSKLKKTSIKHITFPTEEHESVKQQLRDRGQIVTHRYDKGDRYKTGDIVEWKGFKMKVDKSEKLNDLYHNSPYKGDPEFEPFKNQIIGKSGSVSHLSVIKEDNIIKNLLVQPNVFEETVTLYHGSPVLFDKIKPTSFSLGNYFDPRMHYTSFFFKEKEKAITWVVFYLLHQRGKLLKEKGLNKIISGLYKHKPFVLQSYIPKLINEGEPYVYLYTFNLPVNDVQIGHDSKWDEFTYEKEAVPDSVEKILVTPKLIEKYVIVCKTEKELDFYADYFEKESKNPSILKNSRLYSLFMTSDLRGSEENWVTIKKIIKEKPEDFNKFVKDNDLTINRHSLIDKSLDIIKSKVPELYNSESDKIIYKLHDWVDKRKKLLLITGLSGSGKSTLSKQMSKNYNAHLIEGDEIYKIINTKSMMENFKRKLSVQEKIDKLGMLGIVITKEHKDLISKGKEDQLGYELIMSIIRSSINSESRIILEGVCILRMTGKEYYNLIKNNCSVIIMNTDIFTSSIRSGLRDNEKHMLELKSDKNRLQEFVTSVIGMTYGNYQYNQNLSTDLTTFKSKITETVEGDKLRQDIISLTDQNGNVILYHGSPDKFEKTLTPMGVNVGTKLSKPRRSIFLTNDKTGCILFGIFRIVWHDLKDKTHARPVVDFYNNHKIFFWDKDRKLITDYLKNRKIYVYTVKVKPEKLGAGMYPNVDEVTLDEPIDYDTREEFNFSQYEKYMEFVNSYKIDKLGEINRKFYDKPHTTPRERSFYTDVEIDKMRKLPIFSSKDSMNEGGYMITEEVDLKKFDSEYLNRDVYHSFKMGLKHGEIIPISKIFPDLEKLLNETYSKNDRTIWVTSDWHLYSIIWEKNMSPMEKVKMIRENCHRQIKPNDIMIHLGDISSKDFLSTRENDIIEFFQNIPKCTRVLVTGNHDILENSVYSKCGFRYIIESPCKWRNTIFSHFPLEKKKIGTGEINIHGHLHGSERYDMEKVKQYHHIDTYTVDFTLQDYKKMTNKKSLHDSGIFLGEEYQEWNKLDLTPNHRAVAGVVINKQGKILIQDHIKLNLWTVPVGKVEPGDTIENTLKKELREELGININTRSLEKIGQVKRDYSRGGILVPITSTVFIVHDYSGIVKNMEPHKHRSLKWVTLDELKKINKKKTTDVTQIFINHQEQVLKEEVDRFRSNKPKYNNYLEYPKNLQKRYPEIEKLLDDVYHSNNNIWLGSDFHLFSVSKGFDPGKLSSIREEYKCKVHIGDVFLYLGDFLHISAKDLYEPQLIDFFQSIPFGIKIMILGNNDILTDEIYKKCGFKYVLPYLRWENILFTHFPLENRYVKPSEINVHGHLHEEIDPHFNQNNHRSIFKSSTGERLINMRDGLEDTKNPNRMEMLKEELTLKPLPPLNLPNISSDTKSSDKPINTPKDPSNTPSSNPPTSSSSDSGSGELQVPTDGNSNETPEPKTKNYSEVIGNMKKNLSDKYNNFLTDYTERIIPQISWLQKHESSLDTNKLKDANLFPYWKNARIVKNLKIPNFTPEDNVFMKNLEDPNKFQKLYFKGLPVGENDNDFKSKSIEYLKGGQQISITKDNIDKHLPYIIGFCKKYKSEVLGPIQGDYNELMKHLDTIQSETNSQTPDTGSPDKEKDTQNSEPDNLVKEFQGHLDKTGKGITKTVKDVTDKTTGEPGKLIKDFQGHLDKTNKSIEESYNFFSVLTPYSKFSEALVDTHTTDRTDAMKPKKLDPVGAFKDSVKTLGTLKPPAKLKAPTGLGNPGNMIKEFQGHLKSTTPEGVKPEKTSSPSSKSNSPEGLIGDFQKHLDKTSNPLEAPKEEKPTGTDQSGSPKELQELPEDPHTQEFQKHINDSNKPMIIKDDRLEKFQKYTNICKNVIYIKMNLYQKKFFEYITFLKTLV